MRIEAPQECETKRGKISGTYRAEAETHEDLCGSDLERSRIHPVNPIINVLQDEGGYERNFP